jgi:hypothetical protein
VFPPIRLGKSHTTKERERNEIIPEAKNAHFPAYKKLIGSYYFFSPIFARRVLVPIAVSFGYPAIVHHPS